MTGKTEICSQVITMKERMSMLEKAEKEKNDLIQQCMARKDEMHRLSEEKSQGKKYTLLESEAHRRAKHLLQRAFEMKQEQEDEVSNICIIKDSTHFASLCKCL
jgi:hypothetical protein